MKIAWFQIRTVWGMVHFPIEISSQSSVLCTVYSQALSWRRIAIDMKTGTFFPTYKKHTAPRTSK